MRAENYTQRHRKALFKLLLPKETVHRALPPALQQSVSNSAPVRSMQNKCQKRKKKKEPRNLPSKGRKAIAKFFPGHVEILHITTLTHQKHQQRVSNRI